MEDIKKINHGNGIIERHTDEGFEIWEKNGKIHRDNDDPAIISPYQNQKEWWKDGEWHRDNDLPACVNDDAEIWKKNGKTHRVGKPAVIRGDGTEEWYEYDQRHRVDAPAVINADGSVEWWLNDEMMTQAQIDSVILKNDLDNSLPSKEDKGQKGNGKI